MNALTAQGYRRITKTKARKIWGTRTIGLQACNFLPNGPWSRLYIPSDETIKEDSFESIVNNFQWYNCNLHETGYYASFYVLESED